MVETHEVACCIAGGGPAGVMAGYLLARAGVEVLVLEKHGDFLRDFRGDTIHPSTLEVMHELGLLEGLLRLPHQKAPTLAAWVGDRRLVIADFHRVKTRCPFIVLMPQWDFLDFLAGEAKRRPNFRLLMHTEATELIEESGRIAALRARAPTGELEIRADLVIGADGRHSTVRDRAKLQVDSLGAPMDVLWFRLPRSASDPDETFGRFDNGSIFIMINRGDYWQTGFVIAKGSFAALRERGIEALRQRIAALIPFASDRAAQIESWDAVSLLTVSVDRLRTWHRPGLLCIGDAAHAMSPVGGVGINLAIQDAVATANILAEKLRNRRVTEADLHRVQRRREFPTRVTQRMQVGVQDRVISRVLGREGPMPVPLMIRLLGAIAPLRAIPARLIGVGVRPEHVTCLAVGS
jgi:2-polyprenyl-6-methoxyphenol hydroxylase-like FAD-dependent oxidoreductase